MTYPHDVHMMPFDNKFYSPLVPMVFSSLYDSFGTSNSESLAPLLLALWVSLGCWVIKHCPFFSFWVFCPLAKKLWQKCTTHSFTPLFGGVVRVIFLGAVLIWEKYFIMLSDNFSIIYGQLLLVSSFLKWLFHKSKVNWRKYDGIAVSILNLQWE